MPRTAVAALLALLCVFGVRFASEGADRPVLVFAAASLREAFEAAAPAFTKQTGSTVRFEFGGSDALATQLLQGAPADVFASANPAQMSRVAALTGRSRALAKNRLVVIAPHDGSAVKTLADLGKPGVRLVLAAPTVPVGAYAREAFVRLERDPAFGAGFAERVRAATVSEETDVKAVATKVALGEADAGVVYATDVAPIAANVRVLRFPPGIAPDAVYPIAALNNGPNPAGGRAFVAFMTSRAGLAFLKARGFGE